MLLAMKNCRTLCKVTAVSMSWPRSSVGTALAAEVSPGSIGIAGIWQLQHSQVIAVRLQDFGLPEFQFTGISHRSHPPEYFLWNLSQAKHCKSILV